jgi:CRP-like cAMP-binding protein
MFEAPITSCKRCAIGNAFRNRCAFTPILKGARTLIIGKDERNENLYFVREGMIALGPRDAPEASLVLRGPRTLFGIEALRGLPSPTDVWALTCVRVCVLPAAQATEWVGPPDSPGRTMLELLAGDAVHRQREEHWRSGESVSRVARFLLSLAQTPGQPRIPKQILARLLGMRAETFSRCLHKLCDQGLVDISGRVLDTAGLAKVAVEEVREREVDLTG